MVLTLRHFILKQQVLNLYRYAIRSVRFSTCSIHHPLTRKETILWIRAEFERNRHLTDLALIEDKVKMGRREIKQVLPTVSSPSHSH
ncbi:LYR motif-containing protein 2 [Mycena venus]|uniref:LYR motif-containing protein 2 n=1 Tax=Mycena venus TaxID=2733690 RepID=A0A8H7CKW7_9AGAR|nr:LYR motif-containing protein 2 [Mycena venus]